MKIYMAHVSNYEGPCASVFLMNKTIAEKKGNIVRTGIFKPVKYFLGFIPFKWGQKFYGYVIHNNVYE